MINDPDILNDELVAGEFEYLTCFDAFGNILDVTAYLMMISVHRQECQQWFINCQFAGDGVGSLMAQEQFDALDKLLHSTRECERKIRGYHGR